MLARLSLKIRRYEARERGLQPDARGWVTLRSFLRELRHCWRHSTEADFRPMAECSYSGRRNVPHVNSTASTPARSRAAGVLAVEFTCGTLRRPE